MDIHKLFPSQWLSAADLGGKKFELTIESVSMVTVRNPQTNQEEQKPAIKFQRAQKRLILNKTNAVAIAEITGKFDTDHWVGHAVVLSSGLTRNRKPTIIIEAPAGKPPVSALPDDESEADADASEQ